MSWTFSQGATQVSDWFDQDQGGHGPWTINVRSSPISWWSDDSNLSTIVTFSLSRDHQVGEVQVKIEHPLESTLEGVGTWDEQSRTVSGQFLNLGPSSKYEVIYMVASLAQYVDSETGEEDWHLYALIAGDDPEDAAVIGAQGGALS